ncbi:MAG: hypothetical protein A2W91_03285 [Bacteroidetes bacterium GWF2_38_335]|nr:MAG: hypothetical protein A2W91_03285 [Bacteroidetes bacterium GWF2_38_335]OFY77625.1 MAG: hypothetical protein A2281_01475 [Bacteroidetes bacterium RIFOXYA12_FULL_38_20]
MKKNFKIFFLGFLIVAFAVSLISTPFPEQTILQHFATIIFFGIMLWDIFKNYFSISGYLGIGIFTLLHVIGARWIYSFVPYDYAIESVTGISINDLFGWQRNQYDRFVHFMFGVLFFPVLVDIIRKNFNLKPFITGLLAFLFIQWFSMIYELFEWILTLTISKEDAENFNGQQGDAWDPHKDMALAMVGSAFYWLIIVIRNWGKGR